MNLYRKTPPNVRVYLQNTARALRPLFSVKAQKMAAKTYVQHEYRITWDVQHLFILVLGSQFVDASLETFDIYAQYLEPIRSKQANGKTMFRPTETPDNFRHI